MSASSSYIVRRATAQDMPDIMRLLVQVDLVHHAIRPDLFNGPATKYTLAELAALLRSDQTPVFVCTNARGRVLGHAFCVFQQHSGAGVMTDVKTLYIDDLCVNEGVRGQHVGQTLYDHVVQFARQSGCYNITLNVWAGNESALRFYRRQGLTDQKIGLEKIL